MRIDYIEPFLDAASSVLRDMLLVEDIHMGSPGLKSINQKIKGVSVIVGLAGSVEGSIIIDMDIDTALFVASKLNFEEYVDFDDEETKEMVAATLTEVGNIIAGNFVTTLHAKGFVFDITPPAFIYGENMKISNKGSEALIVPFTLPDGKIIEVNIAIRERVWYDYEVESTYYGKRGFDMIQKTTIAMDSSNKPKGINYETGVPFNVLIVDDSVFTVKQLTQIFTSEGFNIIDTAADGEEAVIKYKNHYPNVDVVTLDITMPKMDGITCLSNIMEFDQNAKVIMISALGKEQLVKDCLIKGAKTFIVKPLDRAKVLQRVMSVFIK